MRRSDLLPLIVIGLVFVLLPACTPVEKAESPIKWKLYHTAQTRTENLLVLLPGIHNSLLRFEKEGFFENIRQYAVNFDVVTVDAHIAYYAQNQLVGELRENVILPARDLGYRNIVLGGISLGGYGSLWYNHEYPGDIKGLLLIAPYLGDEDVVSSVENSSSVGAWREQNLLKDSDFEMLVWHWIDDDIVFKKNHVLLAVGEKDKFYRAARILARYIPESQFVTTGGKHNWRDWRVMWRRLLENKKINALFDE